MAENEAILLKINNLHVSYGHITAIKQASLEVQEGEIVTLLGANGAGKSTLLETVVGIRHASSGTITFMGRDITRKSTDSIIGLGIALVPEGRGILPLMTVMENLQLGAYHLKDDTSEYLEWVFDRFPILGKRSNQLAGTLSGGEQQILSIARALMAAPKLLMLDEPSLGLSPLLISEVFKIIADLNKEGYTILLSEQNARKALQYANRAYVFETGNIVLEGTAQELLSNPKVRQAYLGG